MVIPFSRQRQQPMQTKDFEQCQLQNVLWANTWPMPMNMIPLYKAYIILNERRLIFHTDVMTKIQMEELQVILNLPQPTRGSGRHWYSVPGTIHQLQVNHQCRPTEPHSLPRIQRDKSLWKNTLDGTCVHSSQDRVSTCQCYSSWDNSQSLNQCYTAATHLHANQFEL